MGREGALAIGLHTVRLVVTAYADAEDMSQRCRMHTKGRSHVIHAMMEATVHYIGLCVIGMVCHLFQL